MTGWCSVYSCWREAATDSSFCVAHRHAGGESEPVSYLGYRIILEGQRNLRIHAPDGTRLFNGRMELSGARRFIRGYRKEASMSSSSDSLRSLLAAGHQALEILNDEELSEEQRQ